MSRVLMLPECLVGQLLECTKVRLTTFISDDYS